MFNRDTASPKEIAIFVRDALIAQGKPSRANGNCVYLTENGLKCGVGHLITGEEYSSKFEGIGVDELPYHIDVVIHPHTKPFLDFVVNNTHLMDDIQSLHDLYAPDDGNFVEYINNQFEEIIQKCDKGVYAQ